MNKIAFLEGYLYKQSLEKEASLGSAVKKGYTSSKKTLGKYIEPLFTVTSGGGPGGGIHLKGTPFMGDMDATGPGGGVLINPKTLAKWMRKMPTFHNRTLRKARVASRKVKNLPGKIYTGVEFTGLIPAPFVGLAANKADSAQIMQMIGSKIKNPKYRKMFGLGTADTVV